MRVGRETWTVTVSVLILIVAVMNIWLSPVEAQQKKEVGFTSYQTVPTTEMAIFASIPIFMKYYESEGLSVSYKGAPGGVDSIQIMVGGGAQVDYIGTYPPIVARSKGVPLRGVMRSTKSAVCYPAVLDSSPIRDIRQFKGKIIGVNSLGTGCIPVMKAMMAEAGMDPEKDVTFVVSGVGSQALAALRTGKTDVSGLWDAAYWEIEALGAYKFRKISSPLLESLSWTMGVFALEDYIRDNPRVIVGIGRAISKASVFAKVNPEAAVKIHWKVYPASKPTGIDEAAALKRQAEVLRSRIESMQVDPNNMRAFGATDEREARAMYEFLRKSGVLAKEYDPKELYTNEFISQMNEYDVQTVVRQAREVKVD